MADYGRKAFEIGQLYGPQNRKPEKPPIDWTKTGYNALEALKRYLTGNILGEAPVEPLMQSAASAATLPRDVYQGTVDPRSEEGIGRAFELASNVGLGARGAIAARPDLAPGPGSAGMFVGHRAATADWPQMMHAIQLEQQGLDPKDIWTKTKWGKDPKGNWFTEVSDQGVTIDPGALTDIAAGKSVKAGDVMTQAGRTPEFMQAYPQLADYTLEPHTLGPNVHGVYYGDKRVGLSPNRPPEDVAKTAGHEFQHAIQKLENWPGGASPQHYALNPKQMADTQWLLANIKDPTVAQQVASAAGVPVARAQEWLINRLGASGQGGYAGYRATMGEAQAHNVPDRWALPASHRQMFPPFHEPGNRLTQSVPYWQQIDPRTFLRGP